MCHPHHRADIYGCAVLRPTGSIDLRQIDRDPDATVTALVPKHARPNWPFAELLKLSRTGC
jgi:hypothetical protein